MKDDEQSCALRALTLCDGQVAAELGARAVSTRCYCARLAEADSETLEASEIRTARARVVARAEEVGRVREQRSRWLSSAPDF